MAQKRKDSRLPQKLTEYMFQLAVSRGQDSATTRSSTAAPAAALSLQQPRHSADLQPNPKGPPSHRMGWPQPPPSFPASCRPSKAKIKLDPYAANDKVSHVSHIPHTLIQQNPQNNSIASFPPMEQTAMNTTLKDMQVCLAMIRLIWGTVLVLLRGCSGRG